MEVSVLNINGQETGRKVQLNDAIFGIEPNDHVLYLDVKQYLANQRQGTAKSKERSEVSGSTRKLGRQKGGGGARRGDINSPVLVGGGRVFGPKPRNYSFKLNKKVKALARKSALSYKAQEAAIVVVEDFAMEAPKTKDFVNITKNLKVEGKKLLLLLHQECHFYQYQIKILFVFVQNLAFQKYHQFLNLLLLEIFVRFLSFSLLLYLCLHL